MKKIVKQVLGIDVAKKELVVCLGRMYEDLTPELYEHKVFANNAKGFALLILWITKHTDSGIAIRYVMEATGVYHERFAYFLYENGHEVSIVLPNKISNYIKTLDIKTITDRTASEAITRFGLERRLDMWQKPKDVFKKLRQLTRERGQIVEERTVEKNQLHAEQTEAEPNTSSLQRVNERIQLCTKQEMAIKAEITALIKGDAIITGIMIIICSLPGVGILTGATELAETNGFELIRNKRQLTSYAGFDIVEKQSGISVKGKTKISKRGNKYLRKAMHLPSLAAIRSDERFKAIFVRLVSKHGIKMKATVAVQRKLLEMIFILFKSKVPYDKAYLVKANEVEEEEMLTVLGY